MNAWDLNAITEVLKFPNKQLRARAIVRHVLKAGYAGIVCFTCGNAADALRQQLDDKLPLVEVGPRGRLKTDRWWTPEEIRRTWPALFDATSGHLPFPLMIQVASEFKDHLNWKVKPGQQYFVPSGSGETILCLSLAFPDTSFCAVYDNKRPATTRDADAPLNSVIDNLFPVQVWDGRLDV